ncbi:arginine:ornithine antiporter/lysine permease [Agromyces terreus]|uniref:Arginine:ornithine antiporter/lysine permease n=1 Tax=Agromyces terreus TaxID=424795 RepID=A0A9X2H306_9MICO|nr:basic amino acid/polyamine antiporter [Agromyces terreus]MCP2369917.1 arginine:ornithine antiporter/lysine permease [Agromyces terreus]
MTDTGRQPVRLGIGSLTAVVVGSMVGAGVFSLPGQFASNTGVVGALIAWVIAGTGMLMLAFTFQALANRKPHLDAGVYSYAKTGFGDLLGFFSAFGYWASACVGNVTYWVLIMSTLGAWVPALGEGDTIPAMIGASAGFWLSFLLVRRGVREAAALNRIVTVAKLVPIVVFIVIALTVLDPQVFADNLLGAPDAGPLFDQVRGTMLVTVFAFLGVEGASVYSRHARRRADVGRATVLGFLSVLAVFASVTIVSYGVLPASEIAELREPSMAGVLQAAVGSWGAVFVSIGLIIAVLGAYLAWTLMAAEVVFTAARDGDFPRIFARMNARDVPTVALLGSTIFAQAVLVVAYFSADAFGFALDLTSALALLPLLFAAGYLLKIAIRGDGYVPDAASRRSRPTEIVLGAVATGYVLFLLVGAGLELLLISLIVQAPATLLYFFARRENGRPFISSPWDVVVLGVAVAGAVVAIVGLSAGWLAL